MSKQRSGRAFPPGSAPPELWKYLAPTLAPHVLPLINSYLEPGPINFPSIWTDCWLKPLPKPTKPPNSAANLRPIALQDPLGKCIARTLKTRIQAEILEKLADTPQFAYLPSRSTASAISRAARFCAHIRSKLSSSRIEVRDRKAGKTRAPITGGALLSLDMSEAFDYVPHEYLARALQHLGIAADTINIVLALHHTQYHVTHKGHTGYIHLRNGIRQGCTLSPTLWVCASHFLLHQLSEHLAQFSHLGAPEPWISQAITAFADDFLVSFDLNSHQDLINMCTRIGCLFTVLREAKMQINPDKSSLLIRSSGNALAKWVKARTFRRKDQKLIRLGTPFQPIDVGLATRIPYLGTVMSFDSFETQTADLRIQQAKAAVARLNRVLFKKQGLSVQHRLRVYRTCIRSTMSYGLAVVGTSPQALKRLSSLEAKHVRCITGNPRKEDNEAIDIIYQRFEYKGMASFLLEASKRRLDTLARDMPSYPGLTDDLEWQSTVYQSYLNPLPTQTSHKPVHPTQDIFPCPHCDKTFDSQHAMRTHCARSHKISFVRSDLQLGKARREVDIAQHSVDGLPTCKHCGYAFRKWSGFKSHILSACPVLHAQTAAKGGDHDGSNGFKTESNGKAAPLDSDTMVLHATTLTADTPKPHVQNTPPTPEVPVVETQPVLTADLADGPAEQSAAGSETANAALNAPTGSPPEVPTATLESPPPASQSTAACNPPKSQQPEVLRACRENWVAFAEAEGESLKQYCVICTQWCSPDRGGFKSHLRRAHPDLWALNSDLLSEIKKHYRLKYRGPCRACKFVPTGAQKGALHTHSCNAYYQACLLNRISVQPDLISDRSQHDHTSGAGQGTLRVELAFVHKGDGAGSAGGPGPEASVGRPTPEVAEAGRQGERPPAGQAPTRRRSELEPVHELGPEVRPVDRPGFWGGSPSPDGSPDPPLPATGGRPRGHTCRQRLPAVHGDEARHEHNVGPLPAVHQPLLWHRAEMAEGQGGDADEAGPVPPLHPAAGLHDRVPGAAPPRLGAEQQGDLRESRLAAGDTGSAALLDVREVGRHQEGEHPGHQQAAGHPLESPRRGGAQPDASRQLELDSSIQGDETPGAGVRGQHPHVPAARQQQERRGGSALLNDGAPDGLQRHAAHAHEICQGATPPPAVGPSTPARGQQPSPGDQPAQQQLLEPSLHREPQLRPTPVYLRNPHNVCYLNASLTGLLWAGEIVDQPAACFGARASAFRALTTGTARKPVYVPGLFNWASLLQGWRNLTQQHDAAEFSDFLLGRLLPPAFQGAWEARLNDGSGTECRDRGLVPPSLPLTVPESTVSLQALVEAWHHQEATFAFTQAPRFLLLQLKRYRREGAAVTKLKTLITLSPNARILVPRFVSDSLTTESVAYKLCYTVVHEGDSVHSGHYQCALATAGEPAVLLLSNDGTAAKPVKASQMPWIEANCYMVCLRAV